MLKPDKGYGVVILNRSDYTEGILNIINDIHKFKELDSDPIIIREGKLQRFLRDLKRNGKIDKDIYSNIHPTGLQPPCIYGLIIFILWDIIILICSLILFIASKNYEDSNKYFLFSLKEM